MTLLVGHQVSSVLDVHRAHSWYINDSNSLSNGKKYCMQEIIYRSFLWIAIRANYSVEFDKYVKNTAEM